MTTTPPANDNARTGTGAKPGCAICGRPRVAKYDPFCSRRCADVDLYRWLNGNYVIPASDEAEAERGDVPTEDD
jgi:hypothetical protein